MPVTGLKKVGKIKTEVIGKIDRNGTVEHAQLLFYNNDYLPSHLLTRGNL